jgi:hypothetical protein
MKAVHEYAGAFIAQKNKETVYNAYNVRHVSILTFASMRHGKSAPYDRAECQCPGMGVPRVLSRLAAARASRRDRIARKRRETPLNVSGGGMKIWL